MGINFDEPNNSTASNSNNDNFFLNDNFKTTKSKYKIDNINVAGLSDDEIRELIDPIINVKLIIIKNRNGVKAKMKAKVWFCS